MRNENIPIPSNPERQPLAPYDPPDPAPQALAWQRAMRVVGCETSPRESRAARGAIRGTLRVPHSMDASAATSKLVKLPDSRTAPASRSTADQ